MQVTVFCGRSEIISRAKMQAGAPNRTDADRINRLATSWLHGAVTPFEEREFAEIVLGRVKHIAGTVKIPDHYLIDNTDLMSVGVYAALECVKRFNPDVSDYMTFSYARIRGAMIDYLRRMDTVSRPQRVMLAEIDAATEAVSQKRGDEARIRDIAESIGRTQDDINQVFVQRNTRHSASIFTPVESGEEGKVLLGQLPQKDDGYDTRTLSSDLTSAMAHLSLRTREIVTDFYLRDMSQRDIATRYGLTEARISQIRQRGLRQLAGIIGPPAA